MKTNKRGKLIYQPSGAAAEYAKWACNLYNGCSNKCEYCYNRHSQGKGLLGKDEPTIKGSMSIDDAYVLFEKELMKYKYDIIRDGGLFFNFVSDPCLPKTLPLNAGCIDHCIDEDVPVIMLTKMANWVYSKQWELVFEHINEVQKKHLIKFGFTLTGCDELEQGAASNINRISAMAQLSAWGYYTWASIEPIIDVDSSFEMFQKTLPFCEEYRFGLNSLKKDYTKQQIIDFKDRVEEANKPYGRKLVWKESVRKFIE